MRFTPYIKIKCMKAIAQRSIVNTFMFKVHCIHFQMLLLWRITTESLKTIWGYYFTIPEVRIPKLVLLNELTSWCQQNCIPSGDSEGESTSLPFQTSRCHLHSLGGRPFLCSNASTCASAATSPTLTLTILPPLLKTLTITSGPSE